MRQWALAVNTDLHRIFTSLIMFLRCKLSSHCLDADMDTVPIVPSIRVASPSPLGRVENRPERELHQQPSAKFT